MSKTLSLKNQTWYVFMDLGVKLVFDASGLGVVTKHNGENRQKQRLPSFAGPLILKSVASLSH